MTQNLDEIDQLVRQADPLPDLTFTPATTALLAAMATTATPPARKGRHRRRIAVVAIAALLGVGVTGTAFGYYLTARTGQFGPASTESDNSEWLRTDAADYRQVIEELVPRHIPLPAGWSWDERTDRFVAQGKREPAVQQVTGVKSGYAFFAQCAWVVEWVRAHDAKDDGRARAAVKVLGEAPQWQEIAAVDGGGVRDNLRAQAEAAGRGDAAPILEWNRDCIDTFGAAHR